jgi:hypothetical protein
MKTAITIILIALSIGLFAQDSEKIRVARLAVKTAIEAEEKAKFEVNFKEVSPDTLTTKRGVIFIAKKDNTTYYYIKVGAKNYLIDSFDVNLKVNGENYNERSENDTVKLYGDKGVILFTIQ